MFTTPRLVAIALCAALNFAIGIIVYLTKLPIFLNSVGTILCALLIVAGPPRRDRLRLHRGVHRRVLSLPINPFLLWFSCTVLAIALVSALLTARATATFRAQPLAGAGLRRQGRALRRRHRHRVAAIVSAPVVVYLFGGVTGSGSGSWSRSSSRPASSC